MSLGREFAFQFTLYAIARVHAESEEEARRKLNTIDVMDSVELDIPGLKGRITEFSVAHDPGEAELLEINGEEPCRECGEPNPDGGDGWDGLCPTCADRASIILDAEEDGWTFWESQPGWYADHDGFRARVFGDKVEAAIFIEEVGGFLSLPKPGNPHFVFPSRRKLIFVYGCFWHGHGCPQGARVPRENRDYWVSKIKRNRWRDEANLRALGEQGWQALVLWECELKDEAALSERLLGFLGPSGSDVPAPPAHEAAI